MPSSYTFEVEVTSSLVHLHRVHQAVCTTLLLILTLTQGRTLAASCCAQHLSRPRKSLELVIDAAKLWLRPRLTCLKVKLKPNPRCPTCRTISCIHTAGQTHCVTNACLRPARVQRKCDVGARQA